MSGTSSPNGTPPPGMTPIEMTDLLQVVGELYVQIWILRRTIAMIQQDAGSQRKSSVIDPAY